MVPGIIMVAIRNEKIAPRQGNFSLDMAYPLAPDTKIPASVGMIDCQMVFQNDSGMLLPINMAISLSAEMTVL